MRHRRMYLLSELSINEHSAEIIITIFIIIIIRVIIIIVYFALEVIMHAIDLLIYQSIS